RGRPCELRSAPLQELGHLEVWPGGGDFELFAQLSPAKLLIKARGRRAGVAPELVGMIPLAQQPLGQIQQPPPDAAALNRFINSHAAQLPRGPALPVAAHAAGAGDRPTGRADERADVQRAGLTV